jgi:hypothetical protein
MLRSFSAILLAFIGMASCKADEAPPACVDPPFVAGLSADFTPCGCNDDNGVDPADNDDAKGWREACLAADNYCFPEDQGSICLPGCSEDSECPEFMGRQTLCSGLCYVPCADGHEECPTHMLCVPLGNPPYHGSHCIFSEAGSE